MNPYDPPDVQSSDNAKRHLKPELFAWLLLPAPYLICAAFMYGALLVTGGPWLGLLQLAMVSILPLGFAIAAAVLISQYLVRSRLNFALIAVYGVSLFLFWSYLYRSIVTSWR